MSLRIRWLRQDFVSGGSKVSASSLSDSSGLQKPSDRDLLQLDRQRGDDCPHRSGA